MNGIPHIMGTNCVPSAACEYELRILILKLGQYLDVKWVALLKIYFENYTILYAKHLPMCFTIDWVEIKLIHSKEEFAQIIFNPTQNQIILKNTQTNNCFERNFNFWDSVHLVAWRENTKHTIFISFTLHTSLRQNGEKYDWQMQWPFATNFTSTRLRAKNASKAMRTSTLSWDVKHIASLKPKIKLIFCAEIQRLFIFLESFG